MTVLIPILSAVLFAASFLASVATVSAGGVPIEPGPIPAEIYVPPNCEVINVETKGGGIGFSYVECHLPPECEVVNVQGEGGIGFSYIECDLEPGCELASGEWNGHTYWFIDCLESECIGGCDPTTPPGIGITSRPAPLPDPITPPPPPLPVRGR